MAGVSPLAAPCPIRLVVAINVNDVISIGIWFFFDRIFFLSNPNQIPNKITVIIILTNQIFPKSVWITSNGDVSNLIVCTTIIKMSETKISPNPIPVIDINFPWWNLSIFSNSSLIDCLFCVPQMNSDAIIAPNTIVWPTNPGNLAPASGKNINSDGFSFPNNDESTIASPTANKNAFGTKWPSIFERTLVDTVKTPSSNGDVVTISDNSFSKYFVSLLSIWSPLESNTLSALKLISTGSEKITIISVVPTGAFVVKFGIVFSVNGCADANGIEINDITNNKIRNFCI